LPRVIVSAAVTIIDTAGYRMLWKVSRVEFGLAAVAAAAVITLDVLVGVLVAVMLSIVVALYRIARPHDALLGDYPGLDGWVEVAAHAEATTEAGLVVYRFDAPLFFFNADFLCDRVENVLIANPGDEEWLVLDFEGIGALDATAADALDQLLQRLREMDVAVVAVARANEEVLARLDRAALLEPTGTLRVFPTINSAVRAYRHRRA
jgi:sulfate permease, SulP family